MRLDNVESTGSFHVEEIYGEILLICVYTKMVIGCPLAVVEYLAYVFLLYRSILCNMRYVYFVIECLSQRQKDRFIFFGILQFSNSACIP